MKKNQKIIDIKINNKNLKRRIVHFDNDSVLDVSDVILTEFDLYIGKAVDEKLFFQIKKKDLLIKAKKDAIRYLSYRARSEWEIYNKLKNNKYPDKVIANIISWLKEKRLIDDKSFAKSWVRDRIIKKPAGKIKLREELSKKGIDKEIAENAIYNFFTEEMDEVELAHKMINNKITSFKLKKLQLKPNKIINLLKSRGFSYHVIDQIYHEYYKIDVFDN